MQSISNVIHNSVKSMEKNEKFLIFFNVKGK